MEKSWPPTRLSNLPATALWQRRLPEHRGSETTRAAPLERGRKPHRPGAIQSFAALRGCEFCVSVLGADLPCRSANTSALPPPHPSQNRCASRDLCGFITRPQDAKMRVMERGYEAALFADILFRTRAGRGVSLYREDARQRI